MNGVFLLLSAVALAASLMVVLARRTFHSAMYLIVCLLSTAGLFLILGAEFVAATQVVVYAGSVLVLFVFVIMTAGYRESSTVPRTPGWWVAFLFVVGGVGLQLLRGFKGWETPTASLLPSSEESLRSLSQIIFSRWLVPLEALSILILAVMIGISALKREGRRKP
jgi:NADH-quinone oxidoreductase subunit J